MLVLSRNDAGSVDNPAIHCSTTELSYVAGSRRATGTCSVVGRESGRHVREEAELYVPDLLGDASYEVNPGSYAAADEHAKHLRKAERMVDEALNLVTVLDAAMDDPGNRCAAHAGTVLKVIGKRLRKAHRAIDRHGRRHANLFLSWADLGRNGDRNG